VKYHILIRKSSYCLKIHYFCVLQTRTTYFFVVPISKKKTITIFHSREIILLFLLSEISFLGGTSRSGVAPGLGWEGAKLIISQNFITKMLFMD